MAKVNKIMLTNVPALKKEAKVEEAAKLLARHGGGCVVIVENKKPVGIVTELDFVRNLASKGNILKEPVGKIMTSPVISMTPDMKIDKALKIIDTQRFRLYPVVGPNDELMGLVTKKDVVNSMSDNIRFHRNVQNVILIIFVLFEFFVFVLSKYLPFGT